MQRAEYDTQLDVRRGHQVLIMTFHDPDHIASWEELQEIKNRELSATAVCYEIYPAELDAVNQINRRWLWIADRPDDLPNLAR